MSVEAQDPDAHVEPQRFLGVFPIRRRPAGFAQGKTLPEARSRNPASKILFSWLTPLLLVGFSRPLEFDDLWQLVPEYSSTRLGNSLEANFFARVPPSERPLHLRPDVQRKEAASSADQATLKDDLAEEDKGGLELSSTTRGSAATGTPPLPSTAASSAAAATQELPEKSNKEYDRSLLLALNRTVFFRFWSAGCLGVIGFALQTTSPLVSRLLLNYITASYEWSHGETDVEARGIGYGIGLAFALWAMQQASSLFMNQFLNRSLITGFMLRASLIANVSRKSLRLSGESRAQFTNGHLTTLISADASFMDWCALLAHELWIQPIQIVIGIGILVHIIGYSAVVGLGVLLIGIPLQAYLFSRMIGTRQTQMVIVDKRVRLLQEILQGVRVMKLMAYESYFEERVMKHRREEVDKLRRNCVNRAVMNATMASIPVIAAVLTFITYSLSGHTLNVAIIFSALQALNNIRAPLTLLPLAIQSVSDAYVGLQRIQKALLAPEIDNPVPIVPAAEFAVSSHADYAWETTTPPDSSAGPGGPGGRDRGAAKKAKAARKVAKKALQDGSAEVKDAADEATPFTLKGIDIDIPRGSFVVVCGRVGSGKSSLIQALLGEMKLSRGSAYLGGSVSYFPQAPWIQNATLRDNIIFGDLEPDEKRLRVAVTSCALDPDFAMLAHGMQTEIGERGINLSGGQKARACLARCVYSDADICFMDDPLSAVDAHVSGKLVDCFTKGPLKDKTRILVTHHLEVLPKADLIITMLDGRIAEMGTYDQLLESKGAMAKLLAEHLSESQQQAPASLDVGLAEDPELIELKQVHIQDEAEAHLEHEQASDAKKPIANGGLTTKEERTVGALDGAVVRKYVGSMGGLWRAPLVLGIYLLAQTANVGTTVFLSFWSGNSLEGWSQGRYMGVYAALGLSYTILVFLGSLLLFYSLIRSSFNLFNGAFKGVLSTSVAWLDSQPTGRVISRLTKDIITLDDQLPTQVNQLFQQGMGVLGVVALVFYSYPILGVIFPPLFFLYYCVAVFYRASSREVKRLDSNMRSFIYSGFGEMLSGMSSVRAYRAEARFIERTDRNIDVEDQCYIVSIVIQRWLGVRLDALGAFLVLAISLFGVGFRNTTPPAKLGLVLTYSLTLTSQFSQIVNVFAQVEQDLNCAERTMTYAALPVEDPDTETKKDMAPDWPSGGAIDFDRVVLKYREDLPPVLREADFHIAAGEKVGIVGRTGAGKSSLLQALFRTVELSGGRIRVDGEDCRHVPLQVLRSRLGIVPQDPFLWNGSVRANLDPEGLRTDAELNDALRRCHLARPNSSPEVRARLEKFGLDALVQDEGANFSAGERQLLALARVVVRDSKIIVLDEATSSVDVETDSDIQDTIRNELHDKTLLCIAHRLGTVAAYSRVIVLDAGEVAEIDTPLALFDRPDSIFRGMCDKAALSREDIVRIRAEGSA